MFDRHRRLRKNQTIRSMIRENILRIEDLIYPLFLVEGEGVRSEVSSMPGVYHFSLDMLEEELNEIVELGILSVMVFGVPNKKDNIGSTAKYGIVQKGIKFIKEKHPSLYIIADTCLCQYTSHGHCGLVQDGDIENDASLNQLVKTSISQAQAGADMIAPSNMMDGFVYAIRNGLDNQGFTDIPILSYAVKYSSSFYGPFRDAAHSTPGFGDRRSYQMDPANIREAFREATSDIKEGADLLMVKPGLAYIDVLTKLRQQFQVPIVTYHVSGEYSMVKAASLKGWVNEKEVVMETMLSFKRAGADLVITYYAKEIAKWL